VRLRLDSFARDPMLDTSLQARVAAAAVVVALVGVQLRRAAPRPAPPAGPDRLDGIEQRL